MVVVRSVSTGDVHRRRQGALQLGQQLLMRSTTSMTLEPGCRWMLTITAGVSFIQAACLTFSALSTASARSESFTGAPLTIGDDQRPVLLAGKELVVGPDDRGLAGAVKAALGLVGVGRGNGRCAGPPGSGHRRPEPWGWPESAPPAAGRR